MSLVKIRSGADDDEVVLACLEHARTSRVSLPGLDALSALRCRAYLFAATALAALAECKTEKQTIQLERIALGYMRAHDRCAGMRWWSWPSTVDAARRDTREMLERSQSRALALAEYRRMAAALESLGLPKTTTARVKGKRPKLEIAS